MNVLPAVVTFVGAVICAFGGLWAYQQQPGFKRNLAVITFVGAVISASGGFWAYQQQASSELKLANLVIGGDSFCYLRIYNPDQVTNTGRLMVHHQGEYNLYDVYARIVDLEKLDKLKGNLSFDTLRQADTNISIGNLISSSAQVLHPFTLGNGDTRRFNIFFSARNGFFNQVLRFKKIQGKWVSATKVMREEKVLYEKVDDEFPRTAEGNVEW
ncbi:MAG: hypothetical protein OXN90_02035 [Gemmatimonadota bacterium]|nr:hypothetical protein [Gemmatimonadota bacterium]